MIHDEAPAQVDAADPHARDADGAGRARLLAALREHEPGLNGAGRTGAAALPRDGRVRLDTPEGRAWVVAAVRTAHRDGVEAIERLSAASGVPSADLEAVPVGSLARMASTVQALQDHAHASQFDDLTGLPLRAAGSRAVTREIHRALRRLDRSPAGGEATAVAFLDVNNLKAVNDALGHAGGDILLRAVTGTITRDVARRDTDLVVRWGGDEVVVVLPGRSGEDAYKLLDAAGRDAGEAAIAELEVRFPGHRHAAVLTALAARIRSTGALSAGVTEVCSGDTLELVVARGDAGMYADKGRRKAAAGVVPETAASRIAPRTQARTLVPLHRRLLTQLGDGQMRL